MLPRVSWAYKGSAASTDATSPIHNRIRIEFLLVSRNALAAFLLVSRNALAAFLLLGSAYLDVVFPASTLVTSSNAGFGCRWRSHSRGWFIRPRLSQESPSLTPQNVTRVMSSRCLRNTPNASA